VNWPPFTLFKLLARPATFIAATKAARLSLLEAAWTSVVPAGAGVNVNLSVQLLKISPAQITTPVTLVLKILLIVFIMNFALMAYLFLVKATVRLFFAARPDKTIVYKPPSAKACPVSVTVLVPAVTVIVYVPIVVILFVKAMPVVTILEPTVGLKLADDIW